MERFLDWLFDDNRRRQRSLIEQLGRACIFILSGWIVMWGLKTIALSLTPDEFFNILRFVIFYGIGSVVAFFIGAAGILILGLLWVKLFGKRKVDA